LIRDCCVLGLCFESIVVGLKYDDSVPQNAGVSLHCVPQDLHDLRALLRREGRGCCRNGLGGTGGEATGHQQGNEARGYHGYGVLRILIVKGGRRCFDWMKFEICVIPSTVADEMIPVVHVDLVYLSVTITYGF
jgi:hypothetical protein